MKQSEIRNEAKKIVEDIFRAAINSKDRSQWRKAVEFCAEMLKTQGLKMQEAIRGGDDETATKAIRRMNIWREVRNQIVNEIKMKLKSKPNQNEIEIK